MEGTSNSHSLVTSSQKGQYGKGRKSDFAVEKPDRHKSNQVSRVNVNRGESYGWYVPLMQR